MKAAVSQESKYCEACGRELFRRPRDSSEQWAGRRYCSVSCRNKSTEAIPVHLRFWDHVERVGGNCCWPWIGSMDGNGYGQICLVAGTSPAKAHRLSWEIHFGAIPEGKVICHACDNPRCVNPSHLFLGTQKDNMADCSAKGRLNPKSHENLKPGAAGFHGAGPLSAMEIKDARSK